MRLYREHVPDSPESSAGTTNENPSRPTIDDLVTLIEDANGRLAGDIGEIFQDDHDGRPYRIRFRGVDGAGFFLESSVRRSTPVTRDARLECLE